MDSSRKVVTSFALRLALFAIVSAIAVSACNRAQGDWRSAQAADTVESYNQFLTRHADSEYAKDARERIAQLGEQVDWEAAAATDTLVAYQEFLTAHPQSKWAAEARIRIENFAVAGVPPSGMDPAIGADGSSASGAGSADIVSARDEAGGRYGVQLGAFSSSDRANAEWKRIAGQYAGPLEGLSPRVVAVESGGKALYRLQANVMDEAQARAICGALKQGGQACVVVLP
jgi:cell division protein FtsN